MSEKASKSNLKQMKVTKDEEWHIDCFRCGLCCRYRVCLSFGEAEIIARYSGLPTDAFAERYGAQDFFEEGYEDMYWFEPDSFLMRHRNGECFFLEHIGAKETRCRIHPVKPQVCQKYVPSLHRGACQEGLALCWELRVSPTGELEGSEQSLKKFCSFLGLG